MNEEYKPFSPGLHAKWDGSARKRAKAYLREKFALLPVDNPDRYGVDILLGWLGFEPEVKVGWGDVDFPFETLHIPARKRKFIRPGVYFMVFNETLNRIAIVSWKSLVRVIRKKTKYTKMEVFFEIPLERVQFVNLDNKADEGQNITNGTGRVREVDS